MHKNIKTLTIIFICKSNCNIILEIISKQRSLFTLFPATDASRRARQQQLKQQAGQNRGGSVHGEVDQDRRRIEV